MIKQETKTTRSAFTLIELLVVMAIVGVLAGVALITYPAFQRRAHDARRESDLKQYQNALEIYANSHDGFYPKRTSPGGMPASDANGGSWHLCNDLGLDVTSNIDCSSDPKDGEASCDGNICRYMYQSDDLIACGTGLGCVPNYVLWAALEQPENSSGYFVICADGRAGETTTGIPPSPVGTCPL